MTLIDINTGLASAAAAGITRPLDPIASDPAEIRAAFGRFPSGIAALCADIDGVPTGLVATSFSVGVSYDPPLVLFSVQNSSTTWPVLREAGRIGVSILGSEHAAIAMQLASRKGDRFAGIETMGSDDGAIFIHGSPLWMECEIVSETPAGDHKIVLLEVKALRVEDQTEPLIYHSAAFRNLAAAS
ncbi:flavin reductase family protein [Glaciihabitans sp. dw_435]|uniref:flavin reductase family protein n=1 Tax=Glaciihabitans sp. dw_435 TaxID=2720081 RepID=UPI001BD22A90|nr:flavin reductase family protein [Glaciihabitans sp. dw_435]